MFTFCALDVCFVLKPVSLFVYIFLIDYTILT